MTKTIRIIEEIPTSNEKDSSLIHIKQKHYVFITEKNLLKHKIRSEIFNYM